MIIMTNINEGAFGISEQIKAEIWSRLNYLPIDKEREILEKVLYDLERYCNEAKQQHVTTNQFVTEQTDKLRIRQIYNELSNLYDTINQGRLLELEESKRRKGEGKTILTFELPEDHTLKNVTARVEDGTVVLFAHTCSPIENENFVQTEEILFYRPSKEESLLTDYIVLKQIESVSTMETKDLACKTVTFDGHIVKESNPQFLKERTSFASNTANNELIKVLTSTQKNRK